MNGFSYVYTYFIFLLAISKVTAQPTETLRFKKDLSFIYFFQKGTKSDTIGKNRANLFYLLIPDSLMPYTIILVENGLLQLAASDSLVELSYLKGLNYESFYQRDEPGNEKTPLRRRDLKSFINGSSADSDKGGSILVRIIDKRNNKTLLKNVFYYKN